MLKDLLETLTSTYVTIETARNGVGESGEGNASSDFEHVETGVDSDGTTLLETSFVSGVSNGKLLAGVAALFAFGVMGYAIVND